MRSTFKVLFYVNGSKEKNGFVPIMWTGDNQRFRSPIQLQADHCQRALGRQGQPGKGKSREARDINLALDNIKAQIIKHYQRL